MIRCSYGDAEKDAADCKKMYNHTCDIADRMGESIRWTRLCPTGVTTCVWATGAYAGQGQSMQSRVANIQQETLAYEFPINRGKRADILKLIPAIK